MGTAHPDVRALYAYTAQNDEELSFEAGQVFQILEKVDESWWMAHDITKTPPTTGYVPSNYVEEIVDYDANDQQQQQQQLQQQQQQQHEESQNESEAAYMAPDELFNNEGSAVPVNDGTGESGGFYVWTKFPFEAQRPDELSFKANMLLEVLDTSCEFQGWWTAKDKQGGTGLIPGNYVKKIASPCTTPASTDNTEVFNYSTENGQQADGGDRNKKKVKANEKLRLWQKHKAGLLVERLNPFPSKKAEEAKASPGVKV